MGKILRREVPLEDFDDSGTRFNGVEKDVSTGERHLQIDIFALQNFNEDGKLFQIEWILGSANPGYSL